MMLRVALFCLVALVTACTPGQHKDANGLCHDCTAGRFSTTGEASACTACPKGHAAPVPAMQSCAECPAGRFAPTTASAQCMSCPLNTVAPETGASRCEACEPGQLTYSRAATACLSCNAGSYPRSGTCHPARVGHFAATGALLDTPCVDGYHAPVEGMQRCLPCPDGSISTPDRTACEPCGPRAYTAGAEASQCYPCTDAVGASVPQCFNTYRNLTLPESTQPGTASCSARTVNAVAASLMCLVSLAGIVVVFHRSRPPATDKQQLP